MSAAGLGAISKYTDLFFGLGVLAWFVLDHRERRWLLDPWAWAGALIAVAVFLPVIFWNAGHHWVSFAKQFGRIVPRGISLHFVPEFVFSQAGLINPLVAVFVVMGVVAGFKRQQSQHRRAIRFLLALSAPLVLYMLVHSFHDRVQGNWLAPIYPMLALLAAAVAVPLGESCETPRLLRRLIVTATPLGLAISTLGLIYLALPLDVFGSKDPSELTRGWPQLARQIEELQRTTKAKWIATTNYGLTGELAFQLRSKSVVREVVEQERYTFEPPIRSANIGQRALLVVRAGRDAYQGCFRQVTRIGSLDRAAAHHSLETYTAYLAVAPTPALGEGRCGKNKSKRKS